MLIYTIMHQWEPIFTWHMWFWLFAGYWQRNKWTQAFRKHSRPIGGNRVSKTVHIGQHLHWSTRNFPFQHFFELAYRIKAPERHSNGFCLLKEIMTHWIHLIQLIPCFLPVQAPKLYRIVVPSVLKIWYSCLGRWKQFEFVTSLWWQLIISNMWECSRSYDLWNITGRDYLWNIRFRIKSF